MRIILAELRAKGFGAKNRTPEHASQFPQLDQFTFLLEDELGELTQQRRNHEDRVFDASSHPVD